MNKLVAVLALLFVTTPALALVPCEVKPFATAAILTATNSKDCTVGYAMDTDVFYFRNAGSWTAISSYGALANGATITNAVDGTVVLTEGGEDYTLAATSNLWTLASTTGATFTLTPATTISGDLTLGGGAGGLTFSAASSSVVVPNNSATALVLGGSGLTNLVTLDTQTSNQKLMITGTTTATALHVDVGLALFDELVTIGGGAGALTLTNSAASVLTIDNDTSALDIGSSGLTTALRYSSEDNKEVFTFAAGHTGSAVSVTGAATLDSSDCGKSIMVTAAHDGSTITLPALTAVPGDCTIRFHYVGADAGALLDITPNASDGIEGGCTLAASVVNFSGTDDADVGLTKATIQKGDTITLTAGDADDWYASAIQGICANN